MSDQVPAQEQSAPTPTPAESALQASALQDQLATAKMTNQGPAAISELENQLVALLAPEQSKAVVPKEQQQQEATPTPVEEVAPESQQEEKSPEVIAAEAEAAAKAAAPEQEPADRIRMGKEYSDADKALVNAAHMLVKSGNAKNFTEAYARVSGLGTAREQQESEPEAAQLPPELVAMEAEVTGLEAKLDELAAAEGLYTPEIAALSKQLSKANAKLESARTRFETQAETKTIVDNATVAKTQSEVLKATARAYPQMTDKSSEQWKLARDLAKAASDPAHADYETCCSEDAPRFFAEKAARLLQIKPLTAAPSAPQPQPTATSTANKPAPKPGPAPGSRTSAPQPVITAQDIARAADQIIADTLAGKGGPAKSSAPPGYILMGR